MILLTETALLLRSDTKITQYIVIGSYTTTRTYHSYIRLIADKFVNFHFLAKIRKIDAMHKSSAASIF
jgi:hypothetical protein